LLLIFFLIYNGIFLYIFQKIKILIKLQKKKKKFFLKKN